MAASDESNQLHPVRIVIAVILGLILLTVAVIMYRNSHKTNAPAQSTQQMNPNTSRNTPPGGIVNQGGNPNTATTPSPNGTNGNYMSSQ